MSTGRLLASYNAWYNALLISTSRFCAPLGSVLLYPFPHGEHLLLRCDLPCSYTWPLPIQWANHASMSLYLCTNCTLCMEISAPSPNLTNFWSSNIPFSPFPRSHFLILHNYCLRYTHIKEKIPVHFFCPFRYLFPCVSYPCCFFTFSWYPWQREVIKIRP